MENEENTAVEVSEETKSEETKTEKPKLFKKPKVKLYSKHRDEDDEESYKRGDNYFPTLVKWYFGLYHTQYS